MNQKVSARDSSQGTFKKIKVFFRHPAGLSFKLLAILFVASFIILFLRNTDILLKPQFWSEDGRYWYGQAYNSGLASLLIPYAGYLLLFYRFVGLLSLALPFHLAPLAFSAVALFVECILVVFINTDRFKGVFTNRLVPLLIGLVVILLPNTSEIHGNLTNVQWYLAILAFFIIVADRPASLGWKLFDFIIIFFCSTTGPFAILLLPLAIWHYLVKGTPRIYLLFTLGVGAFIQTAFIILISKDHRVGGLIHLYPDGLSKILGQQVFIAPLFSEHFFRFVYSYHLQYLGLCIGLVISLYVLIKGPLWLKMLNILSLLTLMSTYVGMKPQPGIDLLKVLTIPPTGQRYFIIPMVAWMVSLLWLAICNENKLKYVGIGFLVIYIIVGLPRGFLQQKTPYLDFRPTALEFERSSPGHETIIHVNPGPSYDFTLKK